MHALYICIADSALTCSSEQDSPTVSVLGVRTNTKLERSSEPMQTKEKLVQSKSHSLDTAARQTRQAMDGRESSRTDAERGADRVPAASGKGDRQSLKQLVMDKVSLFSF